ncbi:MAG: SpaA isopeptide-forming pilin-related protein, partial [Oscillospiraceae bacterium]
AAANGDIVNVNQIGFPAGESVNATQIKIPQFNVGVLYTGSANGKYTKVQNGDAVSHFAWLPTNKVDVSHGGNFFNRYWEADDFFDGKQELKDNSDKLAGMQPTGTTTVNGDTIVFEGKETGVNIFSLEDRILADHARALNFNVPEGSSVLINVTGSRDNFDILDMQGTWVNGKQLNFTPPSINILWNFNGGESKSINFKKGNMWGSVLAPRAYLSMGNGSAYSTINGNVVAQCIDGNGTNSEIHWWQFKGFDFEKHYNNINFTKVDSADEKALNGAEFTLYTTKYENSVLVKSNEVAKNQAGELIKNVKSTDGKFNIANVPYGTYILEETKVPGGYNKGADVYVVVGEEVTIGNEGAKDVKIANTKKEIKPATFQFYKVGKNGKGLTGAEFEIKGVVGSQTSTGTFLPGDDGKVLFDNLFAGTYVITETKAPKNYKLSDKAIQVTVETKEEDKEIVCEVTSVKMGTVGENGEFDAANAIDMPTDEKKIINKDNEFVFANELKKADLQVSKTDAETDILIMTANAKFALYSDKGCKNQVGDTVTTREGVATFKDLVCGKTYYLKEIEAPNGYVLSENVMPITITFDGVNAITGNKVTVENSKKTGEFSFTKVDENGEVLKGATFKLCRIKEDDKTKYDIERATSDINGVVTFNKLEANTNYFIEEMTAPNGYGVNKTIVKLRLDENAIVTVGEGLTGEKGNYTFANAPLETDFTFFKRESASDQPIMGIKFTLTNNETGTVSNATSLEKGKVTFNGLTEGTYTLHEEVPYGYKGMGDFEIKVKNEKNVLKIYPETGYMTIKDKNILYNTQLTADFSFTKIANDTGKGLDGALFMISLNNSAAEGQTFDTANGGKVTFRDLICGVYTIVEARAPANYGKEDGKIYTVTVKPDPSGKFAVATCDEIANEAGENIIVNNRLTAVYEFIKKDSLTNAPIEGVEFELKANDETSVVTLKSDSTGKVTASNLLAGKTYTITEKTPASGYTNNGKSITVTVDSEGTATASAADNNEFNTESY